MCNFGKFINSDILFGLTCISRKLNHNSALEALSNSQFQSSEEQQNSMQERGYLPTISTPERGEEEDKVMFIQQKTLLRKKGFREISVTDIMPSLRARLAEVQISASMIKNTKGFVGFSKRFSHFIIHPIFLSFLEVSDYLEIRKGCAYLWS